MAACCLKMFEYVYWTQPVKSWPVNRSKSLQGRWWCNCSLLHPARWSAGRLSPAWEKYLKERLSSTDTIKHISHVLTVSSFDHWQFFLVWICVFITKIQKHVFQVHENCFEASLHEVNWEAKVKRRNETFKKHKTNSWVKPSRKSAGGLK